MIMSIFVLNCQLSITPKLVGPVVFNVVGTLIEAVKSFNYLGQNMDVGDLPAVTYDINKHNRVWA